MDLSKLDIAAIVPCHNEEGAIAKVVADLLAAVPTMRVFVYDNCSTDRTAEVAAAAGAITGTAAGTIAGRAAGRRSYRGLTAPR